MDSSKYFNSTITPFTYFNQNYSVDEIKKLIPQETFDKIKTICEITLPLMTLNPSKMLPVTLILHVLQPVSYIFTLKDAYDQDDKEIFSVTLKKTAISVASMGASLFAPHLVSLITTAQDLLVDSKKLIEALKKNDYKKALLISTEILNNTLYLSLSFTSSSQIMMICLSLQIILKIKSSYDNFEEGKYLEGCGNVLTAVLRSYQLKIEIDVYHLQLEIDQHIADVQKRTETFTNDLKQNDHDSQNNYDIHTTDLNLAIYTNKEVLSQKAHNYLSNPEIIKKQMPHVELSHLGSKPEDKKIIDALLENHQGFCVGENHIQDSARAFVINNLDYLKKKKVKILFCEGWDYTVQKVIDKYFSVKHLRELNNSELTEVQKLLERAKTGFINKPNSPHTFFSLLEKTKESGIQMVGIDYFQPGKTYHLVERLKMMNYVAKKVMDTYQKKMKSDEKFLAFMGYAHISRKTNPFHIQGVADLAQIPSVIILDYSPH